MPTFGEELNRLALAVSIVSEESWRNLIEDLNSYFLNTVGACYWEISVAGVRINNTPGLKTVASSDKQDNVYTLKATKQNEFLDFRSFAYSRATPLWIVDKNKRTLSDPNSSLEDKWSGLHKDEEFPKKFPEHYNRLAKTAFFNVLRFAGNNFGVFVLEHEDAKLLTPEIKSDIKLATEALSRIVRVWQITKEQTDSLTASRRRFHEFVKGCSSITDRKRIFIASPSNRDEKVWDAISKVLDKQKYKDRFKIIKWDEKTQPGNIISQILDDAAEAALAICLFSEKLSVSSPSSKKKPTVIDNPNVVFEAGVFQGLVESPEHICKALICIRESEEIAGQPFFDIAQERLCVIERDNKQQLLVEPFTEKLENMLDSVL